MKMSGSPKISMSAPSGSPFLCDLMKQIPCQSVGAIHLPGCPPGPRPGRATPDDSSLMSLRAFMAGCCRAQGSVSS